jgi:hypothetical protein
MNASLDVLNEIRRCLMEQEENTIFHLYTSRYGTRRCPKPSSIHLPPPVIQLVIRLFLRHESWIINRLGLIFFVSRAPARGGGVFNFSDNRACKCPVLTGNSFWIAQCQVAPKRGLRIVE